MIEFLVMIGSAALAEEWDQHEGRMIRCADGRHGQHGTGQGLRDDDRGLWRCPISRIIFKRRQWPMRHRAKAATARAAGEPRRWLRNVSCGDQQHADVKNT